MIEIRELKTIDELEQMKEVEGNIWGMETTVPTHQTVTAIKNGGIIVGAYADGKLIGFSYGFAGFQNGRSYLCSHMLGIEQAYRSHGIGEKLKQEQRRIAASKGYDIMKWTYDPLETRNAYLNLSKLNGICDTYIENCYGEMNDGLNNGLPSDRFEIHWYLTSSHVEGQKLPNIEPPRLLNTLSLNEAGLPVFAAGEEIELTRQAYSMVVPKDFQGLKAANHELALQWRLETRSLFQKLFQEGYAAVRLIPHETYAEYIFVKKNTLELGGKQ